MALFEFTLICQKWIRTVTVIGDFLLDIKLDTRYPDSGYPVLSFPDPDIQKWQYIHLVVFHILPDIWCWALTFPNPDIIYKICTLSFDKKIPILHLI